MAPGTLVRREGQSSARPMIRSLAYRTDLFLLAFEGEVVERAAYVVARTPGNPRYYWGNLLVFRRPPEHGEHEAWIDAFAREVGCFPGIEHTTLGWDAPGGELGAVQGFLDRGFALDEGVVMTAREVQRPASASTEVTVRALGSDDEWAMALENQVACRMGDHAEEHYRAFKAAQMARFRRMQARGLGRWFGAFAGDRLVADLGVFVDEGTGRFQAVGTHPEHRRRGVCARLVHDAARAALDEMGARELVMVAEPGQGAARVYAAVGFAETERVAGVCRPPPR